MNNEILDIKELMERVLDDRELILELLDDFVVDFTKNRQLLMAAIEQKNYEEIQEIAHRLKGAAGNISVKPMYTCCMLIETLAKNKQMNLVMALMTDLDNQFQELRVWIGRLKKGLGK